MTLQKLFSRISLLSIVGLFVFTSCENNDGLETEIASRLTADEVTSIVVSDDFLDDIDNIAEDDAIDNDLVGRGTENNQGRHPNCAERTSVDTATGKIVTIDFGDSCIGRRGKEFSGKIIIEYVREVNGYSKTITFENFKVNGNSIEGSKSISKTNQNANGNPEKTHTADITVTFENGAVVSFSGIKVKEKVEGADTDDRGDDVYSITGNWEHTNRLGVTKTAVITTALTRTYACRYIISGVVEITKNGNVATLDFGNGTCDNLATLTLPDGTIEEITLRSR